MMAPASYHTGMGVHFAPVHAFGRDNERQCLEFPRHIADDSIILKFDSNWMREDPGTNQMTPAYGYVQINKEGSAMAVYHFWGNG